MLNSKLTLSSLSLVLALSLLPACGKSKKSAEADTTAATPAAADATAVDSRTLFERLGGLDAITAVVDDFVANVAADARINSFFANTDIPKLKKLLVEQICAATGGPCTYTGRDMKSSHKGMKVKGKDFDALVEDLVISLDKFKVGEREKSELLGALGSMRADIVEE